MKANARAAGTVVEENLLGQGVAEAAQRGLRRIVRGVARDRVEGQDGSGEYEVIGGSDRPLLLLLLFFVVLALGNPGSKRGLRHVGTREIVAVHHGFEFFGRCVNE